MHNKIELTKQELEDCKKEAANDAVFRYQVLHDTKLLFKILNGLPERVSSLRSQAKCIWTLLLVLFGLFGTLITILINMKK